MYYKALFRINRTKKLAIVAWLLALLTTTPGRILKAAGVQYRYLQILNTIFTLPGAVCVALTMYFYIRVYRGMHKRVNTEMNYTEKIRKRRENAVAKNTLMLTVVLLVCYVPSLTVLFFGMAIPFLRTSSFFRWSELLIQINSLVIHFSTVSHSTVNWGRRFWRRLTSEKMRWNLKPDIRSVAHGEWK